MTDSRFPSDPPTESGLYVVEHANKPFPQAGKYVRLRYIDVSVPGIRVADFDDNRLSDWAHAGILRYRRIDLKKLLEGPRFPSDPPDRPGWWRCKPSADHAWHVYWWNAYGSGELQVFRYESWPKMTVHDCIADGWQFAGRVDMPGE